MAAIARLKGYPIKILMPESVSIERRQMLEVFGAEIILTPGLRAPTAPSAERRRWPRSTRVGVPLPVRQRRQPTGALRGHGSRDLARLRRGHPLRRWTGTSGTLMGTGTYLKERNPDVKVIAVEPPLGERVEGLRNLDEGYIPPVFDQWAGRSCSIASGSCGRGNPGVDPASDRRVRHLRRHLLRRRAGRRGEGGR
jgi:cysteine synthase B